MRQLAREKDVTRVALVSLMRKMDAVLSAEDIKR
jgi:hypothetical protein